MAGIVRWLNRLWSLVVDPVALIDAPETEAARHLRRTTHKTIQQVTRDIEDFSFNTLISRLMEHTTAALKARDAGAVDRAAWDEAVDVALLLTAPLAPHITEELWERRGKPYSIHLQPWPRFEPELARDEEVEVVVQVNGKVRDRLLLPAGADEAAARAAAFASPRVLEWIDGKEPRRVVYVAGKLLNIVV
jgi:leucyl-tRNA synthetase